jgi:hypothetical protein
LRWYKVALAQGSKYAAESLQKLAP